MQVHIVSNDREHKQALERIVALVKEDRPESYPEIEAIAALVENYEKKKWPIEAPDPIEVLEYIMGERNLNQSQLAEMLQMSRGRMSEIMSRKRALTLPMIRNMMSKLGLPADILVSEYALAINAAEA